MLRVREVIVVEGRYDKNTLLQVVDATVLETKGFGVMRDKALLGLFRRAAQERGLLILTDSDGAGFVIRNFLKGAIPPEQVKHAYIPDVLGKERRKTAPGKEGKLGVEGMRPEILLEALRRAGATFLEESNAVPRGELTKADLFELGLTGGTDSAARRRMLMKKLNLPEHMSTNALLQALNLISSRVELVRLLERESSTTEE